MEFNSGFKGLIGFDYQNKESLFSIAALTGRRNDDAVCCTRSGY